MIFESIQAVLTIFILLGIGALLTHRQWINQHNLPLLSKLVVVLAVPCTIFNNMLSAINKPMLATAGSMLIVPALSVCVLYIGGYLMSKYVLRMPSTRQRTFAAMAGCPNTIFIGVPIVMALYGDAGVPAAMFFFICQTTLFWSVGNAGIKVDAQGKGERSSIGGMLKKVFSINVVVILTVFVLVIIGLKPPAIVTNITKYIGGLSTPLSLFFSGNALYMIYREFGFKGLRITRHVVYVIIVRFVIAPLFTFGLCLLFGLDSFTRMVFVLMSGMPIMTQTVILSGTYGGDRDYAAMCFFWTTLASMIIIPLYILIL